MKTLVGTIMGAAVVMALAAPAAAQTRPAAPAAAPAKAAPATGGDPKSDLSIGYQYFRDNDTKTNYKTGIVAALSVRYKNNRHYSIVGEFSTGLSGNATNDRFDGFAGGLRFNTTTHNNMRMFAQGLLGYGHFISDTLSAKSSPVMIQPGAGVEIGVANKVGFRIQGDYRTLRKSVPSGITTVPTWKSGFRFGASLVIHFGVK